MKIKTHYRNNFSKSFCYKQQSLNSLKKQTTINKKVNINILEKSNMNKQYSTININVKNNNTNTNTTVKSRCNNRSVDLTYIKHEKSRGNSKLTNNNNNNNHHHSTNTMQFIPDFISWLHNKSILIKKHRTSANSRTSKMKPAYFSSIASPNHSNNNKNNILSNSPGDFKSKSNTIHNHTINNKDRWERVRIIIKEFRDMMESCNKKQNKDDTIENKYKMINKCWLKYSQTYEENKEIKEYFQDILMNLKGVINYKNRIIFEWSSSTQLHSGSSDKLNRVNKPKDEHIDLDSIRFRDKVISKGNEVLFLNIPKLHFNFNNDAAPQIGSGKNIKSIKSEDNLGVNIGKK